MLPPLIRLAHPPWPHKAQRSCCALMTLQRLDTSPTLLASPFYCIHETACNVERTEAGFRQGACVFCTAAINDHFLDDSTLQTYVPSSFWGIESQEQGCMGPISLGDCKKGSLPRFSCLLVTGTLPWPVCAHSSLPMSTLPSPPTLLLMMLDLRPIPKMNSPADPQ